MNIRGALEREHTKSNCLKIVDYIGDNPKRFASLVDVFIAGPYRTTQRAAWPLSICVERFPSLVQPHLSRLLAMATKSGVHDAVKRNVMRLLQFCELPSRSHGKVAEVAFKFLRDHSQPIAVRVFAMTTIYNLSQQHPDLRNELEVMLEDELPIAGPAFRARGSKILKEIFKSKKKENERESRIY